MLTNAQVYFHTYDKVAATLSALGLSNLSNTLERVQADLRSALATQQGSIVAMQKSQAELQKKLADRELQAAKDFHDDVDKNSTRAADAISRLIDSEG
ncbi:MAG: hypothetical protein ACYCOR_02425 [Acidobacteriaceae bacterium]